jgi:3-oxoacyl-[acyl-carrier protein] reductase
VELGLEGKVAVVTAAGRGLGFAVAQGLVREGAQVAISSRNEASIRAAAEQLGGDVLWRAVDLEREDEVDAFMDAVLERYGRIDILVCNTGGPKTTTYMETTHEDWEQALRMLFWPVFRLTQRAIPSMKENGGGRIVFMTSTWVKQPRERGVLSTVVRSGLSGLSKHLSNELAADNILVNQVLPGPAWTDRSKELTERLAEARGVTQDEIKAQTFKEIPLGRYGLAEEIADAVLFLASDRASFITGASLQVDGGQIRSTL